MKKAVITHHELVGLFEIYPNDASIIAAHQLVYDFVYRYAIQYKIHNARMVNVTLAPTEALKLIKEDEELRHDWLYNNIGVEEVVMNAFSLDECTTGCGSCDNCIGLEQDTALFLELFMQILVVMEYDESTFIAMQNSKATVTMMDAYTTAVTYEI